MNMQREMGGQPPEQAKKFTQKEEDFFASEPPKDYEMVGQPPEIPAAAEDFGTTAEAFFASETPKDYEIVNHDEPTKESAQLTEARVVLQEAEAEETDKMGEVVELFPQAAKKEDGFGQLAENFFAEGEKIYGTDGDNGPDGGGEPLAVAEEPDDQQAAA